MNSHHLFAPALALIASVFWISRQESTLTGLRDEKRAVLEDLGKATTRSLSNHALPETDHTTRELNRSDGSPDWKLIASLLAADSPSTTDLNHHKAMFKLRLRYLEMSEEEIIRSLAEIQSTDLDQKGVDRIRCSLLHLLIDKNPERALALTKDEVDQNDGLTWIEEKVFSNLTKTDPFAAMAWLDQQVDEDHLTSKSLDPGENPRIDLEGELLGHLIVSDPATAKARLASFGEAEREALLLHNFHQWRVDGKVPEAFLTLARENLPEDKAITAIADIWTKYKKIDLEEMTMTLKKVPFSDKEHSALIQASVDHFTSRTVAKNSFEVAYQWAKAEAPAQAAAAIGNALFTDIRRGQPLDEQLKQAFQLSETFDDPGIVREFARQYNPQNSDLTIEDPALATRLKALTDSLAHPGE